MAKLRSPWYGLMQMLFKPKVGPGREFARKALLRSGLVALPTAAGLGTAKALGAKPGERIGQAAQIIEGLRDPQFAKGVETSIRGFREAGTAIEKPMRLTEQVTKAMQTAKELAGPLGPFLPYTAGGSLVGAAALGIPALIRGLTAEDEGKLGWMARNPGIAALMGSALGAAGGGLYKYMQPPAPGAPKTAAYELGCALAS